MEQIERVVEKGVGGRIVEKENERKRIKNFLFCEKGLSILSLPNRD